MTKRGPKPKNPPKEPKLGTRGPKPKATALRLLEGNPSNRPINDLEPVCTMPPVKPSVVEMDEIASQKWNVIMGAMPPQLYTALDTDVLAAHCLAWSLLVKAQKEIDEHGINITVFEKDDQGRNIIFETRNNPAVKVWKAAVETLLKTADRLGLHPGARSRLEMPKRNDQPQSRFAGLLGRTPQ